MKPRILYISGSIGLGHISKDLAIAGKIREIVPEVDITWLAAHPATLVLEKKGEKLHAYSQSFASYSAIAENASSGSRLNLIKYVFSSSRGWIRNVRTFRRILKEEKYDLVIGNETYEIIIGLVFKLIKVRIPFIIIYDFLGLEAMTGNPLERLGNYVLNWIWSRDHHIISQPDRKALFVGVPEDIPVDRFGLLLPHRREYAEKHYTFIGYIVRFDPASVKDRAAIRKELGYGEEPLIICSIGGTNIGRELLNMCGQAYPILKEKIPALHMVLVTGPRLSAAHLHVPADVDVRGYVPDLYKHYAVSDLAVVQCGLSSTLELTALERRFLYFPIEGHSEQVAVAERLERHNAGIRMTFSETTPHSLADEILKNIDSNVSFISMPVNGAEIAAQHIATMLA